MRITLNWLKEFIHIDVPAETLADELTMLGLEIESIERPGAGIQNVVVGQILSIDPHPDADKLVVCRTDVGQEQPLQIVCGAKNMKPGDKVPTAVVGAALGDFKIDKRKMRGVESFGMMCSTRELGLGEDHAGLLILPADAPVGQDVRPLVGLDDIVVEIEITPNRGDWAGMMGVARELSAYYRRSWNIPQAKVVESGQPVSQLSSVTLEAPGLCKRYCGRVIKGVAVGPSPEWLARRLTAAGMRPINNVVDVTNYVLLETGQPLHAFDYDKLAENRIVVRNARPGETIKTIDGESRSLTPDMLVIADAQAPVAVAGVMGGLESEVGEGTRNVFLESAYFHPPSVRKTSRALALQSEASQRFQRGADPEITVYAIDRAAALIQELAGGEVAAGVLDAYPEKIEPRSVGLRYARSQLLLGAEVAAEEQKSILERLGFVVTDESEAGLTVQVPSWRHDVAQEADLIEEIARLHGYAAVPATVPQVKPVEQVFAPQEEAIQRLREVLVATGLNEVMTWTFSSPEEVRKSGLEAPFGTMVPLQNPLAETLSTMRSTLIPGLLGIAARNVRYGSRDLRVFELGPVYEAKAGEELPSQSQRLGMLLTGAAGDKHWSAPQRPFDFYDVKGEAETVLGAFGVDYSFVPTDFPAFASGQGGEIQVDGALVGWLGRVKPVVLKAFDIDQDVFLLEILLDGLLGRTPAAHQFESIPKFPASLFDLAVSVDAEVPAGALRDTAEKAGGKLLKRVNIFDVYSGKQVTAGKKSVALSLVFQSEERTLTETDTQKAREKILAELQRAHGAELR